MLFKMS